MNYFLSLGDCNTISPYVANSTDLDLRHKAENVLTVSDCSQLNTWLPNVSFDNPFIIIGK